jgi:hypothetical protein
MQGGRWTLSFFELLNFVFDMQLFSFEFDDPEIISGWMKRFRLDFPLDGLMTANEFSEMALKRHPTTP